MNRSVQYSNLRMMAVFLMGVTVGICLMLVYITVRGPHALFMDTAPPPAAEADR